MVLTPVVLMVALLVLALLGAAVAAPAMVCSGLVAAAGSTGTVLAGDALRQRRRATR